MLNYPKTGSSFTRAVIKKIHEKRTFSHSTHGNDRSIYNGCKELLLTNIKVKGGRQRKDQHGCYCQIPNIDKLKPVVSVIRNPISRFVSTYEFKAWQRVQSPVPQNILKKNIPSWPDLSIDDYLTYQKLHMIHGRLGGAVPRAHVGTQTIQFIQMFFKNPEKIIHNITDAYIDSDQFISDMPKIYFLRQEDLVNELIAFLKKWGYSQIELEIIKNSPAVNVTEKRKLGLQEMLSDKHVKEIASLERLLYRICQYHGIKYQPKLERKIALP